ncbi:prolyl 4-hydroxylase subunit alpha-1-like [Paramacrobiotus metropolitanus]|uniref:prolyl 4-hydroxylase subunit alpha-1-like n=1 Tax=Paramacrobiotus metropolitanus TaxID=2943436 RepID=UPI002445E5C6|nr:prolyl 4-hydroxylase subunit alpha-1-like [Paramacrobiotus metropolitanus]XP_055348044.1 prolyl 4-hydroxylase subunit alpha-1-like [Paramacrobiotus metropolitanus]
MPIVHRYILLAGLILSCDSGRCAMAANAHPALMDLQAFKTTEKIIVELLGSLLRKESIKVAEIKRYTKQLKINTIAQAANNESGNDMDWVRTFQRVKLHGVDFDDVLNLTKTDVFAEHKQLLRKQRCLLSFPTKSEMDGRIDTLAKFQSDEDIPARDIVKGHVPGMRPAKLFTSEDAFLIGQKIAGSGNFTLAADWLKTARELRNEEENGS